MTISKVKHEICIYMYIYILPKNKPYYSGNLTRCSKVIWPQSPICEIGTSTFLFILFYDMPFINKFVLVRRGKCWRNICKVYLRDMSCYKVNDVATYVITRHLRVVAYITDKQYYQQTQERAFSQVIFVGKFSIEYLQSIFVR